VERSGTQGIRYDKAPQAREAGDSSLLSIDFVAYIIIGVHPISVACSAGLCDFGTSSWGSAALHPRLYAVARIRVLVSNEKLGYYRSEQSTDFHRQDLCHGLRITRQEER